MQSTLTPLGIRVHIFRDPKGMPVCDDVSVLRHIVRNQVLTTQNKFSTGN
jgi:hypothetical protein